jgi:hypothetical protein
MFQVRLKDNVEVVYTVYATTVLENGMTRFLMFVIDRWLWMPAEDFIPVF